MNLHIAEGLTAVARVFSINPHHALALATQGALYLTRAQNQLDGNTRRAAAQAAVESLELSLKQAPYLGSSYSPLLSAAQSIKRGP